MTDTEERSATLELAHTMPGRMRLRWRGDGEPPAELFSRLRQDPDVQSVDYRRPSRSVLILHRDGFSVEDARLLAEEAGLSLEDAPEPPPLVPMRPEPPPVFGPRENLVRDMEALLLLIVVLSWLRDVVVNRMFRVSTILLLLLTSLDLYRYWVRRQRRTAAQSPDTWIQPA